MSNDPTSDKETTTMTTNTAERYVYDHPGDYDEIGETANPVECLVCGRVITEGEMFHVYREREYYARAAHYEPIQLVADGCSFECVEKDAVAGGLRLTRDQLSHAGLDL